VAGSGYLPALRVATLPQDLPKDAGILRSAAQHNPANVGVYASVLQGGKVRRGDSRAGFTLALASGPPQKDSTMRRRLKAGGWSFYIWIHSGVAADNGPLQGERVRRSRG
jgi:hypothetical protein